MKYLYQKKTKGNLFAFFIKQANKIEIELKEDSFVIDERPFIGGCVEILLKNKNNINYYRNSSLKVDEKASFLKIEEDYLIHKLLNDFQSGFMINRSLCLELVNVNSIISEKQKLLGKDALLIQHYSEVFFKTISYLEKVFFKNRFPWIESVITENKNSLIYIRGMAINSMNKNTKIVLADNADSESTVDFKKKFLKGSIICKEGDSSDEVYIMESGKLEVFIQNKLIDVIDQKSSIIGEMALILDAKRNATIKAKENSILRIIKKSNFKKFCDSNKIFLKEIALNLANRIYSNCEFLEQVNKDLLSNKNDDTVSEIENYKSDLTKLKKEIKYLSDKHDFDWLTKLYINLTNTILKNNEE